MKKLPVILGTAAIAGALFMSYGHAEDKAKSPKTEPAKALKNQTVCPVLGNKIDSTAYSDIQGQRVYYCCPACSKKMKADPDKYFKKAAEQGVLFQNIQKSCPVSGEAIDSTVFTDYQGRRIYFCCKKCIADFEKSPADILSKMDKPAVTDSLKMEHHEAEHQGHEMHGH